MQTEITQELVSRAALAQSEMQSSLPMSEKNCRALTKTQATYLLRYATAENVIASFSPDKQVNFARYPQKCLVGNCPTLVDVRCIWGGRFAELWLECQLKDLSEYAGAKEKPDTLQIEETARVIAGEFYYLKLSEFMLFFAHFKAGRYGKFYGSVDPLVITEALQKFKLWRFDALNRVNEEEEREKRNAKPANDPDCCTWAEWQELRWLFNMGYERGKDGKIK